MPIREIPDPESATITLPEQVLVRAGARVTASNGVIFAENGANITATGDAVVVVTPDVDMRTINITDGARVILTYDTRLPT